MKLLDERPSRARQRRTPKERRAARRLALGRARIPASGWAARGAVRNPGFTLIELMVVIALLGILSALIIPEMKGTFEEALLRSTGRRLVSVFNLANSQAITLNQLLYVRLDRAAGRYSVESPGREYAGETGGVAVRDLPGGEGAIDQRLTLEIRRSGEDSAKAPDEESAVAFREDSRVRNRSETIVFRPDGTAEAVEIRLKDRQGFRLALRLDPTTARVQIIEMERE